MIVSNVTHLQTPRLTIKKCEGKYVDNRISMRCFWDHFHSHFVSSKIYVKL